MRRDCDREMKKDNKRQWFVFMMEMSFDVNLDEIIFERYNEDMYYISKSSILLLHL